MERRIYLDLERLLEKNNVSRYELAKRTNVKYQIIDNYYKNKIIRYDKEILLKICVALNCNIADLVKIDLNDCQ